MADAVYWQKMKITADFGTCSIFVSHPILEHVPFWRIGDFGRGNKQNPFPIPTTGNFPSILPKKNLANNDVHLVNTVTPKFWNIFRFSKKK